MDVYLPAGKDKANLIFLPGGAVGGNKTNLNKKVGGEGKFFFFSVTSVWITFLSNGRVRQEEGVDPGQLNLFV